MVSDLGLGTRASDQPSTAAGQRSVLLAYLPVVITAGLLAILPLFIGDSRYFMSLAMNMLVFAAYAVAFNLIFGSTGQLFLCLGPLAGLSAYSSVVLGDLYDTPLLVTIPLGMVLSASLGGLFSWIAVRRQLDVIFIGIVTLAFSLVFYNLLLGGRGLTGGETGMVVTNASGTFLRDRIPSYYLFLALLVGFLALYRWLERSHFGWAFRALRDDELAAELAGIDVARYKVAAASIGSAMLGLTGALFAAHDGFISPTTFAFGDVDVRVLVILAFGGIGSLLGPVIGAATVTVIDELLRPLGQLRLTAYGVVLMVLFLGFRGGVVGTLTKLDQRLRRR
jgi:ABC-type branched-subunit amino acid transport system permease subunit